MQAGKMRHRMDHFRPAETVDSSGAVTMAYTHPQTSIWCHVRNVSRSKTGAGDIQPVGTETMEIRARYNAFDNPPAYGDYLTIPGHSPERFEIVGIENVRELDYELILTATRVDIT